ncbi:snRNA-activating protein complex subunit 2 [Halichoeres trimaculatus]|uniref:snRNA-activating protein complex subunit 2 n=1 Tax=Halichoeres trimaculatus TaxID=147232 RepID=UPI003D9F546A
MKPPPRKRSRPERKLPEPVPVKSGKWQRFELIRLLSGLKRLGRTAMEDREVDCCALKEHIKTRSEREIRSMVDSLKERVISCASLTFKKRRWEERRATKPIELWTHMSSSVAGTQEETINTAFAQMLIVSSKEPRTLKNCDPPRVHAANPDQSRPAGRTVPFRPMPRPAPGPGVRPGSSPAPPLRVNKTPSSTVDPARKLSAPSQVVQVPSSKVPAPQTDPETASLHQTPKSSSALASPVSTPSPASLSSASSPSPAPHTQPSLLPLSSQAATLCARFGRTSKYATEDSPRVLGVKCVVDFEKIYRYLSSILKPDEDCCLTPMEGAIVLDLLMSLPEELPQLDCNKLRKHLSQVYKTLSSPSDSKPHRDLFKDLQDGLSPATEPPAGLDPQQSPRVAQQPQEDASIATSNQEADTTRACPPLNPFMVPVGLLKRRDAQPQPP